MEKQSKGFVFDVSTQIKEFYETAVIFVTDKDYSSLLFHNFCAIRDAIEISSKDKILELIIEFHLKWLQAVTEIEKITLSELPREVLCRRISYTIDALNSRMTRYRIYVEKNKTTLSQEDQTNLLADLELIEEMHSAVIKSLLQKMTTVRQAKTDLEYKVMVSNIIDELFQWLDKINDEMALKLSKHIKIVDVDLAQKLVEIVNELKNTSSQSAQKMLLELHSKGKELSTLICVTAGHSLEISKIHEKINTLDDLMKFLETDDTKSSSPDLVTLKNKKEYFVERLTTLDALKTNLKSLQRFTTVPITDEDDGEICVCEDFFRLRIFNHSLPLGERERLVTELCYLWDVAVNGEPCNKSIISILSAADEKEEFTDELGTFFIDEHSRKIYKLTNNEEEILYQPNEQQELVPVCDDADHVYFYDACGRYFIDANTKQRVYKAHVTASEYMMDSTGVLLKVKEERDGVVYYYDNYGRYYINSDGKHIYRDIDATSEYENDGLGNLVRIRDQFDRFEPCPEDAHVTEDFKYLKEAVGKALRECIAQVLRQQPSDPIKYLSKSLIKYRQNLELRDRHNREFEELETERKIRAAEELAAMERVLDVTLLAQGGSEDSYDSNLVNYTTTNQDDTLLDNNSK